LSSKPRLRVVAAAIFDGDRVLIAQRPEGKHMAGWWEFPGGKVAGGESDAAALVRELREELGIESRAHRLITTMSHEYPDRIVDLALWQTSIASGEPRGLDGQQLQWVACQSLGTVGLLPADLPLVPALMAVSSAQLMNGEQHGR
jgi:8-oxo-dGTP diphosphatase